ncbi:MAG: cbb3-type cytochrome c oxidase subunit 3 [Rhodothermales bacterium]|nr:cbb3-type cytochrome c oxidase subunit 3 [Rhodothermales bacterium]
MIRDILSAVETGVLAQIGLLAFVVAFVAIVAYAFTMRKSARTDAKNLPLNDGKPVTPNPA